MDKLAVAFALTAPFVQYEPLPPLTDLEFLPKFERKEYMDLFRLNQNISAQLEREQSFRSHLFEEYRQAMVDSDNVALVWTKLDDAVSTNNSESYRRVALYRIREILGDEVYYSGRIPLTAFSRGR